MAGAGAASAKTAERERLRTIGGMLRPDGGRIQSYKLYELFIPNEG
jgi:hypothetical protein